MGGSSEDVGVNCKKEAEATRRGGVVMEEACRLTVRRPRRTFGSAREREEEEEKVVEGEDAEARRRFGWGVGGDDDIVAVGKEGEGGSHGRSMEEEFWWGWWGGESLFVSFSCLVEWHGGPSCWAWTGLFLARLFPPLGWRWWWDGPPPTSSS